MIGGALLESNFTGDDDGVDAKSTKGYTQYTLFYIAGMLF